MEKPETYHMYMYEYRTLSEIYQLLMNTENIDECSVLKEIAKMAYDMSQIFHKQVTVEFVQDYLDDKADMWEIMNNLSRQTFRDSPTFSRSHHNWIWKVKETKLKWDWEPTQKKNKLTALMNELHELQQESKILFKETEKLIC